MSGLLLELGTVWTVFTVIAYVLFYLCAVIMILLILARPTEGEGLSSAFGGGSAATTFGVQTQKTVDKIIRAFALVILLVCVFLAIKTRMENPALSATAKPDAAESTPTGE